MKGRLEDGKHRMRGKSTGEGDSGSGKIKRGGYISRSSKNWDRRYAREEGGDKDLQIENLKLE